MYIDKVSHIICTHGTCKILNFGLFQGKITYLKRSSLFQQKSLFYTPLKLTHTSMR